MNSLKRSGMSFPDYFFLCFLDLKFNVFTDQFQIYCKSQKESAILSVITKPQLLSSYRTGHSITTASSACIVVLVNYSRACLSSGIEGKTHLGINLRQFSLEKIRLSLSPPNIHKYLKKELKRLSGFFSDAQCQEARSTNWNTGSNILTSGNAFLTTGYWALQRLSRSCRDSA